MDGPVVSDCACLLVEVEGTHDVEAYAPEHCANRPRPGPWDHDLLLYFTYNYATYCIAASGSSPSPRLHALIEEIRLLELRLECTLQVVHVPGVVMITQGTDRLSRGVWVSPLHELASQQVLAEAVFALLSFDVSLVYSVLYEFGLANLLLYLDWLRSSEFFTAPWAAFDDVDPCDAATVDLPENVGQVCLCLRAEIKSARDHTADVVMAFQTLSGYCLGRWFHLLRRACALGRDWRSNPRLVFIQKTVLLGLLFTFVELISTQLSRASASLVTHTSQRLTVDLATVFRASSGLFTAIVEPQGRRYRSRLRATFGRPRMPKYTSTLAGAGVAVEKKAM
jgi:hypothetical protein